MAQRTKAFKRGCCVTWVYPIIQQRYSRGTKDDLRHHVQSAWAEWFLAIMGAHSRRKVQGMLGKRVWRVSQGIKDYCNDNPLISHVFLNTTTLQLLSLRTKRVINISQNRPLPNFQNHLLTVFSSSFYSNLSQSSICPKALKIVYTNYSITLLQSLKTISNTQNT